MLPFTLNLNTRVIYRPNALDEAANEIKRMNLNRVLIVTDAGLIQTGIVDRFTKNLQEHSLCFSIYDEVNPNPTVKNVQDGFKEYQIENAEAVIAIGGGSSIDTAKGIAILATNGGRIEDYFGAFKVVNPIAPLIAIPTTAGTGSEVSTLISIKDDVTKLKYGIRSEFISPELAVLDPVLLSTLPSKIAAETSMDTLTHLIESYVSKGANPFTDSLSIYGIEFAGLYLTKFVSDRSNLEAASNMMIASMLGGIVISHARTGAAHTLTRPLGDNISHGLANAIVLPHVMEFNLMSNITKFSRIARALGEDVQSEGIEEAQKSIMYVRRLNALLGIPRTLSEVGINKEEKEMIAKKAYELDVAKLNPRDLGIKEIESILEKAI